MFDFKNLSSFEELHRKLNFNDIKEKIYSSTENDVLKTLSKSTHSVEDLITLYSPAAEKYIEEMAQKASVITKERFGSTILLYAPLYLSNVCCNGCLYCGFSVKNKDIVRRTLTYEETDKEIQAIADMGIKHVLLLTGEAEKIVPIEYLVKSIEIAKKHASYIGVEIYPLGEEGYHELVKAGADGLTLYQETYNPVKYAEVHPTGRKKDMAWRLNAQDRGAKAGFSIIGVGALLGLDDPRTDAFFTALHAAYLMKYYWRSHITISFPRIRAAAGCDIDLAPVSDKTFVQLITATRIILRDVGIIVSTRETSEFRNNLIGLGVTQMSAGSATEPGGYTAKNISESQFKIEDDRSVRDFSAAVESKGYEAVTKDWDKLLSYIRA